MERTELRRMSDLLDDQVPLQVPVGVVELLEVVDVQQSRLKQAP
jgi:hypothetical protein